MTRLLPVPVAEVREDVEDQLDPIGDAEADENAAEVSADGRDARDQRRRDLLVALSAEDQPDDLGLPRGEAQRPGHLIPFLFTQG